MTLSPQEIMPSMGRRGERPCFISADAYGPLADEILAIPGVQRATGGFNCTWDIAWAVAALAGVPAPQLPLQDEASRVAAVMQMPGLARYRELGFAQKLRGYQKEDALQLALWHWGFLAEPMRSGKTPITLAAAELVGAEKILCVVPALPKLGWAEEIAAWCDEEAVILYGRAGKVARVFCKQCAGRGFHAEDGSQCDACKLLNGQSNGLRLIDAGHGTCTKHDTPCPACAKELHETIDRARYVIVNYELIVAQQAKDAAGVKYIRPDLLGWVPHLARYHFDLVIADEAHMLRGRNTDETKKGQTRREKFNALAETIDRCWLVGGTPQFSYVRDWWGQLDAASCGAATSWSDDRLFFDFDRRYCNGDMGEYGWENSGSSQYAETELHQRIQHFAIMRPRSEILPDLPKKQRQVLRIEADVAMSAVRRILRGKMDIGDKTKKLMAQTAKVKLPHVLENTTPELIEGLKIMVVCFNPDSAELYADAFKKQCKKREYKRRLADVRCQVWCAHGEVSIDARRKMGRAFREHQGAGVFVMTIGAFQVGVSLRGAVTEHWIDMHHDPSAMLQAEDRPYEPDPKTGKYDERGLSLVYYVVKGTIDEHREARFLPKVDALARVTDEEGAVQLRATMTKEEVKESLAETLERLAGHIGEDWEDAA